MTAGGMVLGESGKWGCFFWNGVQWRGESGAYPDEMFNVVGPRIPAPDEPWQCVPVEPTDYMLFKAETAAMNKDVDTYSPTPTEHPDDGGGPSGYYYRALLAAAPKP